MTFFHPDFTTMLAWHHLLTQTQDNPDSDSPSPFMGRGLGGGVKGESDMPEKSCNPECTRLLNDLTEIARQSRQDAIVIHNGSLCVGMPPQPGELFTTSYLFLPGPQEVRCLKVCIPLHTGRSQSVLHQVYALPLTLEGLHRAWSIVQRRLKRSNHVTTT